VRECNGCQKTKENGKHFLVGIFEHGVQNSKNYHRKKPIQKGFFNIHEQVIVVGITKKKLRLLFDRRNAMPKDKVNRKGNY